MSKPTLRKVYMRLFADDLRELKLRAKAAGLDYQVYLRSVIHNVIVKPKKVYKFIVPPKADRPLAPEDQPADGTMTVSGCLAIAAASSLEEALAILRRTALEDGLDARWLKVADVVELPITENPSRLGWSQE